MPNLTNKVAIVTGSSRGIGAVVARHLAEAGVSVVVNYSRNSGAAEKVVREIKASGGSAIAVKADVGNPADVELLFDSAISAFKKVDILVNNAGIITYKTIADTPEDEFDEIFRINVKGVFLALRQAVTRLENNGRIVNFSSSVTRLMLPRYGAYSASKAAVEQLSRVFAKEVGSRGITVNCVLPGPTDTELFREGKTEEDIEKLASLTPFGRIGTPEDIARVVLFLVSDEAAWVSAQSLGVNGGFA
jgi:3-oxoacyl-[acyl-carrier protein] reductase